MAESTPNQPTAADAPTTAGQARALPPELARRLTALGIDAAALTQFDGGALVGVAHAAGPADEQAAVDRWIAAGGALQLEPLHPE